MLAQRATAVLAFATLLGVAPACDDPCLALTRDLCLCERTEFDQQSCIQRIEAVSVSAPTSAEEDCCIRLQETCTCDQLGDGNLAACGIAQEQESTEVRQCLVTESLEPDPG
jgi:hypothetical protein